VATVFWSDNARTVLDGLPDRIQREVRSRLRYVQRWPEFYPLVDDRPGWEGHRRFVVARRWAVLYRIMPLLDRPDQQIYVTDIRPATSNY
jgi:hypothetical protein